MNILRIHLLLMCLCVPSLLPAASLVTIDAGPVAGYPSLAIGADGFPVIAYDTIDQRLGVIHCADIDCSAFSSIVISDPPTGVTTGRYNSIAIASDGNPAIAFYDPTDLQLKLVKCMRFTCGGSSDFRTIDPGPSAFSDISLAFDPEGNPVVAYRDLITKSLNLARCQNPGCANVDIEALLSFDGITEHGSEAAVAISASGVPVVSGGRIDSPVDSSIDFVRCAGNPCNGTPHILFGQIGESVDHISMALRANELPVFAFHGRTSDSLIFGRCDAANCSGSRYTTTIDAPSVGAGAYTAITVRSDGRPIIAYQKGLTVAGGADVLYVAECAGENCGNAELIEIDRLGNNITGIDPVIAIGSDGGALIAYRNLDGNTLMLAKCSPQSCRGSGDVLFANGFD